MKFTNNISRERLIILVFIVLTLFVVSCEKDEQMTPTPDSMDNPVDETPSDSGTSLEAVDKTFLTQVRKAADEYEKNEIWNGYDFAKRPMYLIYVDKDKKPQRGYIVNANKTFEGATKITGNDALGLDLHAFNKDVEKAFNQLKEENNGNGLFDFYFDIEGEKHYLQIYNDQSVADVLNPALTLAVHEVFHIYQFDLWEFTPNALQDQENYPITEDLLGLQILTANIAAKMPVETNKDKVLEYLKMYVAIRSKEMELDPSPQQLIRNMANEQEKIEGIARYIDNKIGESVINGFETSYSDPDYFSWIKDRNEMRSEFAFGIWYGTGAAVTYMLKNQEISIEADIKNGKTLFDVAEAAVQLSSTQKTAMLEKAKNEFNWPAIEAQAKRLVAL